MNLKNKKVIITGATGGIGNSLVKKFFENEAKILALEQMMRSCINYKEFNGIQIEI